MNPLARGLAALLRLVALGLLAVGGLSVWLEFLRARAGHEANVARGVWHGVLVLAGLVLLVSGGRLARRLTRSWDD